MADIPRAPGSRHRLPVVAAVLGAVLIVTSCSSSGGGGGSSTGTTPPQVSLSIQVNPGGVISWLPYVAQTHGDFTRQGLNVTLVPAATGVTGSAALESGSVQLASLDPLLAAPLLSKGQSLKLVSGNMLNYWQVYAKSNLTGTTFPTSMTQFRGKKVAVAALGGAGYFLMQGLDKAAGLSSGSVNYVAVGSAPALSAALQSGSVDGAEVEAVGGCLLAANKYTSVISFADANRLSSLPTSMQGLSRIPDFSLWATGSWANANAATIKKVQAALIHAWMWASNSANADAVTSMMRQSPYNVQVLDNSSWKNCVTRIFSDLTGPYFSQQDGEIWSKFITDNGIASTMPPVSQWLDASVPATANDAKKR